MKIITYLLLFILALIIILWINACVEMPTDYITKGHYDGSWIGWRNTDDYTFTLQLSIEEKINSTHGYHERLSIVGDCLYEGGNFEVYVLSANVVDGDLSFIGQLLNTNMGDYPFNVRTYKVTPDSLWLYVELINNVVGMKRGNWIFTP